MLVDGLLHRKAANNETKERESVRAAVPEAIARLAAQLEMTPEVMTLRLLSIGIQEVDENLAIDGDPLSASLKKLARKDRRTRASLCRVIFDRALAGDLQPMR